MANRKWIKTVLNTAKIVKKKLASFIKYEFLVGDYESGINFWILKMVDPIWRSQNSSDPYLIHQKWLQKIFNFDILNTGLNLFRTAILNPPFSNLKDQHQFGNQRSKKTKGQCYLNNSLTFIRFFFLSCYLISSIRHFEEKTL